MKKDKKQCNHKWGKLEKELHDSWAWNDGSVKFYYQRCKKCGTIKKI